MVAWHLRWLSLALLAALTVAGPAAGAERYAVLFAGGGDKSSNYYKFYDDTLRMWEISTQILGFAANHVYILFADGLDPQADQNLVIPLSAADKPKYINSDWSTVVEAGSHVAAGNSENLKNTLAGLAAVMTPDDLFYLYCDDHGGNNSPILTVNRKERATHNDCYLVGWNSEHIPAAAFASWVDPIQAGKQVYAFGHCYSEGIADKLNLQPQDGRFAAWAAAWFTTSTIANPGEKDWDDAWAENLQLGVWNTHNLGLAAINGDQFAAQDFPGFSGDNLDLGVSWAYYDYTYHYSSGDYYQGQFMDMEIKYALGTRLNTWVNGELQGYYEITGKRDGSYLSTLLGQIYVTQYFDSQSQQTYVPVNDRTALGLDFLGSETGYIIKAGVAMYRFGGAGHEEADVFYNYYSGVTLSNGTFYQGLYHLTPERTEYFGVQEDNPDSWYYLRVEAVAQGPDQDTFSLISLNSTGDVCLGWGLENKAAHWGMFLTVDVAQPDNHWLGVYYPAQDNTYQYDLYYNNNKIYQRVQRQGLPADCFVGELAGNPSVFFLSQHILLGNRVKDYPQAYYWGLIYQVCLLEYQNNYD